MKWGILSTAKIAGKQVLPALKAVPGVDLQAIGSSNAEKVADYAQRFGIRRVYETYDGVLSDPNVDIVYIPLPNHLHVPWIKKAVEAGKHVLCEKPIALSAQEVADMIPIVEASGCVVAEAFMVRHHPKWHRVRHLVQDGALGQVMSIQGAFSYINDDPNNIRNQPAYGGGGLLDIGVYPLVLSRFVLGQEPLHVQASIRRHPQFGTDMVTTAQVTFPNCDLQFMVSTQTTKCQQFIVHGSKARLEMIVPFNTNLPGPAETQFVIDHGFGFDGAEGREVITMPAADQFEEQVLAFERYVRGEETNPYPLSDSLQMMRILDAITQASEDKRAIKL